MLIAATALSRDLTLVTRNTKDVQSSGALLLNPWHGRSLPSCGPSRFVEWWSVRFAALDACNGILRVQFSNALAQGY